ncbi:hypothetical protein D3C80_1223070 [compost metagenome]
MLGQLPGEHVVDGIEMGAAMVIDHPLGVARGARGVVERNRLPLVRRQPAGLVAVAPGNEGLVGQFADQLPLPIEGIVDGDDQRLAVNERERLAHQGAKLPVHQYHPALGMLEDEGHGLGIEPGVDGVEHGAAHGYPEVGLEHGRDIGGDDGNRIPLADAVPAQGRGELATAHLGLGPALAQGAVDQGRVVGIDPSRPGQKAQGGQGLEIGGRLAKASLVDVRLCHRVPSSYGHKAGGVSRITAHKALGRRRILIPDEGTKGAHAQVLAKRLKGLRPLPQTLATPSPHLLSPITDAPLPGPFLAQPASVAPEGPLP